MWEQAVCTDLFCLRSYVGTQIHSSIGKTQKFTELTLIQNIQHDYKIFSFFIKIFPPQTHPYSSLSLFHSLPYPPSLHSSNYEHHIPKSLMVPYYTNDDIKTNADCYQSYSLYCIVSKSHWKTNLYIPVTFLLNAFQILLFHIITFQAYHRHWRNLLVLSVFWNHLSGLRNLGLQTILRATIFTE